MINKINNNQFPKINAQPRLPKGGKSETAGKADASLQITNNALIEKAKQKPDSTDAVENAKKLLAQGQLDTPENILNAAKNIVEFGI